MERGWFTQADQNKPRGILNFLSKVDCIPKSIIRETAAHFREGASPDEIIDSIGNTRRVALSGLYAEVLRRSDIPSTRAEALVRSTEASSVKRIDIVTRIWELIKVNTFHRSLSRVDLQ